ncbi:MAG: YlmC/YmxH family sporulation protein [Oscillospiraceae bacterium]|nr:YlmC/YmxH family sporulation protein [Oscillospiraceae bacterium]
MGMRVTDLSCKEVVCIADGARLGYVTDVEVEVPCGQVKSIVVPGKCRWFGLFGHTEDYVIPWEAIRRVGDDILLVECRPADCRCPRPKPKLFGL